MKCSTRSVTFRSQGAWGARAAPRYVVTAAVVPRALFSSSRALLCYVMSGAGAISEQVQQEPAVESSLGRHIVQDAQYASGGVGELSGG